MFFCLFSHVEDLSFSSLFPKATRLDNGLFVSPFRMEQRNFNDVVSWMTNRQYPTFDADEMEVYLPCVDVDLERILAYEKGDASQVTWVSTQICPSY